MGCSTLPAFSVNANPQLTTLDQLNSSLNLDIPEATPFRLSLGWKTA